MIENIDQAQSLIEELLCLDASTLLVETG